MIDKNIKYDNLRKKAEETFIDANQDITDMTLDGIRAYLQELNIHKIELDLQNEELLRTQEHLEIANRRYFHLFEHAPVGYLILNLDYKVLDCNHTVAIMLSCQKEMIIGKLLDQLIHPSSQDNLYFFLQDIKEKKRNGSCELQAKQSVGKPFWALFEFKLVDAGKEEVWYLSIMDINEQKIAEKNLEESRLKYKAIFDSIYDIYFQVDLNKTITNITPSGATTFGYDSAEELYGKNFADTFCADKETCNVLLNILQRDGFAKNFTLNLQKKNGQKIVVEANIRLYFNENGSPEGFEGIMRDVTERLTAESLLVDSEERYRLIFENAPVGVIFYNKEGIVTMCNQAHLTILGATKDKVIGFNVLEKVSYAKLVEEMKKPLEGKSGFFEGEYISATGGRKSYIKTRFEPIRNIDKKIIGGIGIVEDITEKVKWQNELIRQKEKAEEASMLKSIILANLNHELRTPLNGILGSIQLLKMNLISEEDLELLDIQLRSADRLYKTLNNLLTLSELEAKSDNLKIISLDIEQVIAYTISTFQSAIEEKGLQLVYYVKDKKLKVSVDEIVLNQIITNVLDNAVKFTKTGSIQILVSSQIRNEKLWAIFKISDTGIGIEENKLLKIFEPFRQASEGISRTHEGIGIGLSITKKMVELLQGNIKIVSKISSGTSVEIELPGFYDEMENNETKY